MKMSSCQYSQCLYFSSQAFARKVEKLAQKSWKKIDLSPSHAYLLMLVIESPGVQPGLLAEQLHLTPSTVTRLIDKLELKKMLVRTTDGKLTNVYPTPKAKELLPTLRERLTEFYENYSSILGKEESARMVKNMNQLTDKLKS